MLNNKKYIIYFIIFIEFVSLVYSSIQLNSRLQVEIDILPVQSIQVKQLFPLSNINKFNLDVGFIEQNNIFEINFSSNVPWEILFFTSKNNIYQKSDNNYQSNNFYLSTNKTDYIPIDLYPKVLISGDQSEKNKLINIDIKRYVDWSTISQGYWDMDLQFLIREKK